MSRNGKMPDLMSKVMLVVCLTVMVLVCGYKMGYKAGVKAEADKPRYEIGYRWNAETGWYDKLDWVPMNKNY